MYRSLESTIRRMYEGHVETDANDQIAVGSYQTKAFEMSKPAQKLFMDFPKDKDVNTAQTIATLLDKLFGIEKITTSKERTVPSDVDTAKELVDKIKDLAASIDMQKEFEFVQTNLNNIKKYSGKEGKLFASPPKQQLPDAKQNVQGKGDRDIDNTRNYAISRSTLGQRKLKIIDVD